MTHSPGHLVLIDIISGDQLIHHESRKCTPSSSLTFYLKGTSLSAQHPFHLSLCTEISELGSEAPKAFASEGIQQTRTLCEHFHWSRQLRQYVKSRLATCPGCKSLLQRLDLTNLCMKCPFCSETKGETFQFCWACLRKWKGGSGQGDSCANESCHIVALLQSCEEILNPALTVNGCPSVRACPQCKALVAHSGGCKYVTCRNCANCFCFRCLDSFNACSGARPNWYSRAKCEKPKAARQTFASESDASPLPIH
ncbi:cullin-9-like isoform X2 [Hypanus sabinus]|uniref:cullin-9-like isoform X2 n=1 Tax=Hypanus sabinus TaxID=79690 RepID=UPI0028C43477|nr:cullin-9-like isoform X2 [Hypanus sabinus]